MSDTLQRDERIIVFDDNSINDDVYQQVETKMKEYVANNYPAWSGAFVWHENWHANGDGLIAVSSNGQETAECRFGGAFAFCQKASFKGVCVFDFNIPGVNTGPFLVHFEDLGNNFKDKCKNYPGLLLAVAAARNPNAVVDIYFATSTPETMNPLLQAFTAATGKKCTYCRTGLTELSEAQLSSELQYAVAEYIKTHSPDEIVDLFWPHDAQNWFKDSSSRNEVPHNRPQDKSHSAFNVLSKYATRIATFGNMIEEVDAGTLSGAQAETLYTWVNTDAGYEVLKSFVGHCSPCFEIGAHTHQLKLSAFTVALLAAVGPGNWLSGVPWEELSSFETAVLGKRKDDCRQAVLAAYRFFETLKLKKGTKERNDVTVRFSRSGSTDAKKPMAYLDVSFGFSCLDKDGKFLQRLSGGSVEPEDTSDTGDSSEVFRELKQALRNPNESPRAHIWVYPEKVDGVARTVIRFGVYR